MDSGRIVDAWMDGWMHRWMDGCHGRCIHAWMDAYMYVQVWVGAMTDIIIIITYQVVCENNMDGYILQIVSILILRYFSSFIFVFYVRPLFYMFMKNMVCGGRQTMPTSAHQPGARGVSSPLSALLLRASFVTVRLYLFFTCSYLPVVSLFCW